MDATIPTNLVCVLFDPAIPTSSFNYIVFYACFCSFLFLFRIIHASITSDMVFPLTHVVGYIGYFQTEAAAVNGCLANNCVYACTYM